jgi:hypothetical protein
MPLLWGKCFWDVGVVHAERPRHRTRSLSCGSRDTSGLVTAHIHLVIEVCQAKDLGTIRHRHRAECNALVPVS